MRTHISSKGQIVIPHELRELDKIRPGQRFSVERVQEGRYILQRLPEANHGLLEWLRACPEHHWFEPVDSESTDTL